MKISIIGSFRKYYQEIVKIINQLEEYGIKVLSPKTSEITHSVDDFVIFASDNSNLEPYEIQTETLNKILKSDVVYVYDPKGYVGRTTCYEIGVLRTTDIPLLFYECPKDLPIKLPKGSVVKPEQLFFKIKELQKVYHIGIDKNKIKNSMVKKNIVLCGSMKFYDEMVHTARYLESKGVQTIIPEEENEQIAALTAEEFQQFKKRVSNRYLSKIRESSTFGVLIMNYAKNGRDNYIGANTLVEISMAFCWGRRIYLYNNYYDPLRDELEAWETFCLKGDVDLLIEDYKDNNYSLHNEEDNNSQLIGQIRLDI